MKVYLMMKNDEELNPTTLLLIKQQSDAEDIVRRGFADYYEVVEVLSENVVDRVYERYIGRA